MLPGMPMFICMVMLLSMMMLMLMVDDGDDCCYADTDPYCYGCVRCVTGNADTCVHAMVMCMGMVIMMLIVIDMLMLGILMLRVIV